MSHILPVQRTFTALLTVPAAGTATTFAVYPQNTTLFGNALSTMASVYAMFRFKRLEFELLPPSASGVVCVAYQPLSTYTASSPANFDDVVQMEVTQVTSAALTVPRHLSVGPYELVTEKEFRWFRCSATGTGALNPQGLVVVAQSVGASPGTIAVRVSYLVEFCAANDAGIQLHPDSKEVDEKSTPSGEEPLHDARPDPYLVGSRAESRDTYIVVPGSPGQITPAAYATPRSGAKLVVGYSRPP